MTELLDDFDLNPLTFALGEMVDQLWIDIHSTSEMLELCRPCGVVRGGRGEPRYRAATNEESCIGSGAVVAPRLDVDLRKPIPKQVAKWLRGIVKELSASADQIDLIEDGRDLKAIRKLVKAV